MITTKRLVISIIFLSLFAMATRIVVETDLFWHLATGKFILETKTIPLNDPFSYTKFGVPWKGASVAWISQTILYLLYSNFGYGSLHLFTGTMVVIQFAILYQCLSGGAFLRGFTLILAATTASVYWSPRPYIISFVFTALFLWILEKFRWRRNNKLWLLPIIMVIWVNSHGGFIYGLILWGIYGLSEGIEWIQSIWSSKNFRINNFRKDQDYQTRIKPLLIVALFLFIATTINPSGITMLTYPYETISQNAASNLINEWQSPNFHDISMMPYIILLVLTIGSIGISKKSISWSDFLLLIFAITISLVYRRNIPIYALILPIVFTRFGYPVAEKLGDLFNYKGLNDQKPPFFFNVLNWSLLIIILGFTIYKITLVVPSNINNEIITEIMPSSAVEIIKGEGLSGNLFNSYNWGGYLILMLPEYPVYIDGRADLYGDEHINEWISIIQAEDGWQEKLAKRNINIILTEPFRPFTSKLESEGWKLIYEDGKSMLFTH